MRLDELPQGRPAYVDRIDWARISAADGQRLREFGMCEGASVELLHRGGWGLWGKRGSGAVACRIGRMTIAMRASHAAAVEVVIEAATQAVPANREGALLT